MSNGPMPSPEAFFSKAFAFQQTASLRAAIELDLFTALDEGAATVAALAKRCAASERGIRILCDYLTIIGVVAKNGDRYALTPDSRMFLSRKSPAFLGGTIQFLASSEIVRNFDQLADTIRRGTVAPEANTVAGHEQDHWVTFAKAMVPMMMPAAIGIAEVLQIANAGPTRVLDIAAGHGIFGIVLAQRNPRVEVTAVDWPGVLSVARDNAKRMGVGDRVKTVAGDAFHVEYGTGYDVALLTNFLHHYDAATCTALLRKVASALGPGGKAVILEFVPNDDRVTPPMAAAFSLTMLAGTPAGDAYTLAELGKMASDAGFSSVSAHALPMPETVVVATK